MTGVLLLKISTQAMVNDQIVTFDDPPVYDDHGFFDSGEPTRITIPPELDGARITFGCLVRLGTDLSPSYPAQVILLCNGSSTTYDYARETDQGGIYNGNWPLRLSFSGAPIPVVAGDYFEIQMNAVDTAYTVQTDTKFWARVDMLPA